MITPGFLAYIRIFGYLLVIIAALFLINKKPNPIYCLNIVIASLLCFNAIQFITGTPNTPTYQIAVTIFVGVWALAHVVELLKK